MVNRNLDISTGLDRSMIADVSTIAWRHVPNIKEMIMLWCHRRKSASTRPLTLSSQSSQVTPPSQKSLDFFPHAVSPFLPSESAYQLETRHTDHKAYRHSPIDPPSARQSTSPRSPLSTPSSSPI